MNRTASSTGANILGSGVVPSAGSGIRSLFSSKTMLFAVVLAITGLLARPVSAAGDPGIMAAINRLAVAFNSGDMNGWIAGCTDKMSILDELPPHDWEGVGTAGKWWTDYAADARKNDVTSATLTLGRPSHIDVSGEQAYVVVPTDYIFRQHGRLQGEIGSTWTFALHKAGTRWLVTGWAWSKR